MILDSEPMVAEKRVKKPVPTRHTTWANSHGKRALDIGSAAVIHAFFAVPMVIVGACIALESRGPVLFKQPRVGRGGRTFTMYKFRTMKHEMCEADGTTDVVQNDARVTRVGAFIRKTHLDELPQLWNVMKGDMSMVGTRPHTPKMHEFFTAFPGYEDRNKAKPGVTGLSQIRMDKSFKQDDERNIKKSIWLDNKYLAESSLATDTEILLNTIPRMVGLGHRSSY